jgi:hypothetical protein
MRTFCIVALLSTLTPTAVTAEPLNTGTGKQRDQETCTRIVSGHPLYQRPGGGLTDQAETSIRKCMRGEDFPLPQVDPRPPPNNPR